MSLKEELYSKVLEGDAEGVEALTAQGLERGLPPGELLNDVLIAAMGEVGERFERREFFVPEMLVAARAMKAGVKLLRPSLTAKDIKSLGTVVIGTVAGDLHDIGKNLVVMMLEGTGFEVIDLGVDVTPAKFLQAIREHSPQIIGMSALLTTTMLSMKSTLEAIEEAGLRDKVVVMVGGAPVTQRFADSIGADVYGQDANAAVRKAKKALAVYGGQRIFRRGASSGLLARAVSWSAHESDIAGVQMAFTFCPRRHSGALDDGQDESPRTLPRSPHHCTTTRTRQAQSGDSASYAELHR